MQATPRCSVSNIPQKRTTRIAQVEFDFQWATGIVNKRPMQGKHPLHGPDQLT